MINKFRYRVNQWIRLPQVQLIDQFGKPRGVVATSEALQMARESGLDLVEVNPSVRPSICKIMDFGQFQYKQKKLLQQQKTKIKKTEVKGIRLSLNIGKHDLEIRQNQVVKFLNEGHQIRIEIVLKGRERQHADLARQVIENFVSTLGNEIVTIIPFSMQGGRLSLQIGRKSSINKSININKSSSELVSENKTLANNS